MSRLIIIDFNYKNIKNICRKTKRTENRTSKNAKGDCRTTQNSAEDVQQLRARQSTARPRIAMSYGRRVGDKHRLSPRQNAKPARGSHTDGSRTTLRQSAVGSQAYRDTLSTISASNQPKINYTIQPNVATSQVALLIFSVKFGCHFTYQRYQNSASITHPFALGKSIDTEVARY